MELFTSFDGRISRKTFWFGMLGIVLISFVFIFGFAFAFAKSGSVPSALPLIISLLLLYPAIALSVKRLHDRNKAAMPWIAIFFLPGLISNLMQILQIDYTVMDAGDMMDAGAMMNMMIGEGGMLVPGKIAMVVGGISMIVGLWALIELGFLKGTSGENSYGADPLG